MGCKIKGAPGGLGCALVPLLTRLPNRPSVVIPQRLVGRGYRSDIGSAEDCIKARSEETEHGTVPGLMLRADYTICGGSADQEIALMSQHCALAFDTGLSTETGHASV